MECEMQIAEVKASSNPDAMKSEGNDSLDTIIRQAIGKEPFLSFSRAGDSPVQLIQLLHALDRQEPLGWTLLSPPKVQMQKCDKCSREFCSSINYRRHIRVHHRLKKLDKDSMKNRDLLGAFWDKLTMEDVKEVVSFKNVTLEEVPGSSIIIALTTLVHQPGFLSLPHMYIKAGSAVLDIIEARPSRFAISSQELFSILDDASEKTFLSGSVLSMQRYIFDGDAGKIGLESKNLVACTSFLLEQKLIKAWLADKDTEAMRFQKMLVEEEEAAHRRHAELLERKRQKKIRQKELKAREQEYDDRVDVIGSIDEMLEAELPAQASASYETCNLQTSMPEMSHHITCSNMNHPNTDTNADSELHLGVGYHCDLGPNLDVERHTVQGTRRKHLVGYHWQEQPKSQRATSNFFLAGRNSHPFEIGGMQSCRMQRDLRTTYTGNKIWSRKHKPEFDGEILKARVEKEDPNEPDQKKNHKVVIGSITVSLGDCTQEGNNLYGSCHACLTEHQRLENNFEDKPNTPDSVQVFANRSTVRLWRPVSRNGVKGPMPVQNNTRESNCEGAKEDHSESLDGESCPRPCGISMNDCDDAIANCSINPDGTGSFGLSSHAAKAFLAQRWKAAIATEHVRLVLSPESEDSLEVQNGSKKAKSHSSKLHKRNILGIAEYGVVNVEPLEISTAGAAKPKSRLIPEKRIKYIPKPRTPT